MNDLIVAISAIEHHVYCPRQCALIHADGLWLDNEHTVRGAAGHHRVDTAADRVERGHRILRHLPLWSERYGLSGRADAVAMDPAGAVFPIEYKIGTRHGDAAHLQLCAQGLCLEEMFESSIDRGYIWYSGARHRTPVVLDADLRDRTVAVIEQIRSWLRSPTLPPAPMTAAA